MSNRSFWIVASFVLAPLFAATVFVGCGGGGGGGGSGTNQVQPPAGLSITQVFPNTGNVTGGLKVTITGTGFASGATVSFGANAATGVNVLSTNTLECLTPANQQAVAVDVTVSVNGVSKTLTGAFTYSAAAPGGGGGGGGGGGSTMTFTSITPNTGSQNGGTIVQIQGTGFTNITQVTLGGTPLTSLQNPSSTLITGVTGPHAPGQVPLAIFSSSASTLNQANAFNYTLTGGGGTGNMTVTNVTPSNGPLAGGTSITITGTNFKPTISVSIAGVAATAVVVNGNQDTITCTTPAAPNGFGGGPVNLTVSSTDATAGQVSLGQGFTYNGAGGAPTLTAITPNSAPESGGTKVTITGTNFLSGSLSNVSQVLVGGRQLLNLQVVNANTMTGTIPVGVAGASSVAAFNTNGVASNSLTFTYTPALFVTEIKPNQGPAAGGTSVTIKGRNFSVGNIGSITFTGPTGSADAISVNVVDANTVTAIVPPSPIKFPLNTTPPSFSVDGPVNVTVNGVGIASGTFNSGYTYGPVFEAPSSSEGVAMVNSPLALASGIFVRRTNVVGCAAISKDAVAIYPNGVGGVNSKTFTLAQLPGPPTNGFNNVDLQLADMDNDGTLDLVILRKDAGLVNARVLVLLVKNPGSGLTLAVPTGEPVEGYTVPGTGDATSLAVGFFNSNDGLLDVAISVTGGSGDRIDFLKGTTDGSGKPGALVAGPAALTLPNGSKPSRVLVADPNDTTTDPKQFREPFLFPNQQDMRDFNSDGKTDLVVARAGDDMISVLATDGATAWVTTILSTAYVGTGCKSPTTLAIADLNGNGTLDVVCGNNDVANPNSTSFSVFVGNGSGAIAFVGSYSVIGPGTKEAKTILIGDWNSDCQPDVIVGPFNNSNFSIFLGNGNATFGDAINYVAEVPSKRNNSRIIAVAPNLTNIQFTGVICLDANSTQSDASVTFVPKHLYPAVTGQIASAPFFQANTQQDPQAVAIGDLNGDGFRDVIVANRAAATLQIWLGDGQGNFRTPISPIGTGKTPESVYLVDANRDGKLDCVVACAGDDAVFVHLNLGSGQLAAGTKYLTNASGPHQVIAVDMNNDKRRDLVTVNQFGNSFSVLLQDPNTGNYVAATNSPNPNVPGVYPVGNAPLGIAIADLNGDNKLDVVTANSANDTVTVLLRTDAANGGTDITFANGTDYSVTAVVPAQAGALTADIDLGKKEPVSVAVGDLNGDGTPDLVTADKFANTFTILHGDPAKPGLNFFTPGYVGTGTNPCGGIGAARYYHYGSNVKIGANSIVYATGKNPLQVFLYDMDLDGVLDVVTANGEGSATVYVNTGAKTQQQTSLELGLTETCSPPFSAAAATVRQTINVVNSTSPSTIGETSFYKSNFAKNPFITFTTQLGAPDTAMAIGRLRVQCPPTVATTHTDNTMRIFDVK